MKKLVLLIAFFLPVSLHAQFSSVKDGPATLWSTWLMNVPGNVGCNSLKGGSFRINNQVNFSCNNFTTETGKYVRVNSGGAMIFEENTLIRGSAASFTNTIRSGGMIVAEKDFSLD